MFRLRCIPHASKIREKRARRASPSTPIVNVVGTGGGGIPVPIHPFPRNFPAAYRLARNSHDICPAISFCRKFLFLLLTSSRSSPSSSSSSISSLFPFSSLFSPFLSVPFEGQENSSIFPFSYFIFSLNHFSSSFASAPVREQFRLFEQRCEYYSADYVRLFRLKNPLREFHLLQAAVRLSTIVFFLKIYIRTLHRHVRVCIYMYSINRKRYYQTFQLSDTLEYRQYTLVLFSLFLRQSKRSKFSYIAMAQMGMQDLATAKRHVRGSAENAGQ